MPPGSNGTKSRPSGRRSAAEGEATETSRLLRDDHNDHRVADDASDSQISSGDIVIDDFAGLPWWRTPSPYWLLGPFALFTLAFGGVIVPKLNLILDLVCKQYFADQHAIDPNFTYLPVILGRDNPQCSAPDVKKKIQKKATLFMLVMNLVTGILSAIVAPKIGHLSDRVGRTRLMAFVSIGGILNEIITILAAKFPETFDYRILILGATFDGMTGSFTAGSILSQSYTSDSSVPSKRAVSMSYIHACLFTGLAFGPLLAAQFVKWTGNLLIIFYIVLGCHIFFMLFCAFILPESVSKRKQLLATEHWKKMSLGRRLTAGSWLEAIRNAQPFAPLAVLWPREQGTSKQLRINLVALATTDMIIMGAMVAAGAVVVYYSELMFNWGTVETSRFISALSMVRVIILMGLYPLINYFGRIRPTARRYERLGIPVTEKRAGADKLDIWVLRIALLSDILGALGYVLVRTQGLFVAAGMVTAVGGLGSATIQSAITKHVPPERVGQVLGAVGMLHAIGRIIGPIMFNGLYASTIETFPQAIFVLLLSLFFIGFVATFFVRPHVYWEASRDAEQESPSQNEESIDETIAEATIEEDQIRWQ